MEVLSSGDWPIENLDYRHKALYYAHCLVHEYIQDSGCDKTQPPTASSDAKKAALKVVHFISAEKKTGQHDLQLGILHSMPVGQSVHVCHKDGVGTSSMISVTKTGNGRTYWMYENGVALTVPEEELLASWNVQQTNRLSDLKLAVQRKWINQREHHVWQAEWEALVKALLKEEWQLSINREYHHTMATYRNEAGKTPSLTQLQELQDLIKAGHQKTIEVDLYGEKQEFKVHLEGFCEHAMSSMALMTVVKLLQEHQATDTSKGKKKHKRLFCMNWGATADEVATAYHCSGLQSNIEAAKKQWDQAKKEVDLSTYLQEVDSLTENLRSWTAENIPFPANSVANINDEPEVYNLVEYIGKDCEKNGDTIYLDARYDSTDKECRQKLYKALRISCCWSWHRDCCPRLAEQRQLRHLYLCSRRSIQASEKERFVT